MADSGAGRVLVDVDTQVDFMDPAGKLYVPGAEEIVPRLEALFAYARRERIPVLSTADSHRPDDPEFADWPAHCVAGTPGQAKIPQTLLPRRTTFARDAATPADWSRVLNEYDQLVFLKSKLSAFDNPLFGRAVEQLRDRQFVVFGVATEHCVNLATRGLLSRAARVCLVRDAIRAVAPEAGERVCRELRGMGAEYVTSTEVIGQTV